MWPDNRLTDLLGLEHPIIQAPMAGHSTPEMAIAVRAAGGLGSLAAAGLPPSTLKETLSALNVADANPLNVNFFAHRQCDSDDKADSEWLRLLAPCFKELSVEIPQSLAKPVLPPFDDEMCAIIEALTPRVVSFHFGLPEQPLLERVRQTGALIMSSATTVQEALWLEAKGCDIIIAQGAEAGGHRGMFLTDDVATQTGTMALVPRIVDAVSVPVVAAGGISDGRGIAAAFALGACGVLIGTAFLKTPEANLPLLYGNDGAGSSSATTVITNVMSGRPARCVSNRLIGELGPINKKVADFPKGMVALSSLRAKAEGLGRADFSPHYRGQGYDLAEKTTSRDLVEKLKDDALARLMALAGTTVDT